MLCTLVVCHYLMFFVYSRKVNDSNDSVIIRLNEKNSPSRDDIKTPNMSESSSSKELSTDEEIHPSGSNKMRFANTEEIKHDHSFYDERRYEKQYTWLYYNFNKIGYLYKICELFYGESSAKPGRSRGNGHIMLLSLR